MSARLLSAAAKAPPNSVQGQPARVLQTLQEPLSCPAGFTYRRRNDLPQGTILIENQNMIIKNSTFRKLAAFGQASVILINSQVYFDTVTFDGNYQSNAGAINVNQSSNATIVNSVFTNNFGYQAGAIAVGCKSSSCLPSLLTAPLIAAACASLLSGQLWTRLCVSLDYNRFLCFQLCELKDRHTAWWHLVCFASQRPISLTCGVIYGCLFAS